VLARRPSRLSRPAECARLRGLLAGFGGGREMNGLGGFKVWDDRAGYPTDRDRESQQMGIGGISVKHLVAAVILVSAIYPPSPTRRRCSSKSNRPKRPTVHQTGSTPAPGVRMSLLTRFHRSKCRQHARAVRAHHSSWHRRTNAIGTADTHSRWTPRGQPFSHGLDPLRTFAPEFGTRLAIEFSDRGQRCTDFTFGKFFALRVS
jgi:hypothetical protein